MLAGPGLELRQRSRPLSNESCHPTLSTVRTDARTSPRRLLCRVQDVSLARQWSRLSPHVRPLPAEERTAAYLILTSGLLANHTHLERNLDSDTAAAEVKVHHYRPH